MACKCSLEQTVMAAKGAIFPLSLALCNIITSPNWFLISTNLTISFSFMSYFTFEYIHFGNIDRYFVLGYIDM